MMGLCLVAAFAFSALVATAAQAYTNPEYKLGVCVAKKKSVYANSSCTEVAMKKGKPSHKGGYELATAGCVEQKKAVYANSSCTEVAMKKGKPSHKGHYERTACYPAVSCGSFPYTFESVEGATTIKTESTTEEPEKVVCAKGKNAGEYTSTETSEETITFEECKNQNDEACTSPLATPAGTIVMESLLGYLEWVNVGETEPGIWARSGHGAITFKCGAEEVELEGHLAGAIENTPTGETITFNGNKPIWSNGSKIPVELYSEPSEEESTLVTVEQQTGAGVNP